MHRIEVSLKSHLPDARGLGLVKDIHDLGITTVSEARVMDIYWLDAELASKKLDLICQKLLADPITQDYQCYAPLSGSVANVEVSEQTHTVQVAYNAGVADPVEETIMKAVRDLGIEGISAVKTATRYLIKGQLSKEQLETICDRLLVNPIIQHVVRKEESPFLVNPEYKFEKKELSILGANKD